MMKIKKTNVASVGISLKGTTLSFSFDIMDIPKESPKLFFDSIGDLFKTSYFHLQVAQYAMEVIKETISSEILN